MMNMYDPDDIHQRVMVKNYWGQYSNLSHFVWDWELEYSSPNFYILKEEFYNDFVEAMEPNGVSSVVSFRNRHDMHLYDVLGVPVVLGYSYLRLDGISIDPTATRRLRIILHYFQAIWDEYAAYMTRRL